MTFLAQIMQLIISINSFFFGGTKSHYLVLPSTYIDIEKYGNLKKPTKSKLGSHNLPRVPHRIKFKEQSIELLTSMFHILIRPHRDFIFTNDNTCFSPTLYYFTMKLLGTTKI